MLARFWADAGQCWDRCDGVTGSCTRCRPIQKRREASKQWPHSESNQRCIGPHSLLLLEENENKRFSQNVAPVVYFWLISMAQFGGFSPVLFSSNGGGIPFPPIPFHCGCSQLCSSQQILSHGLSSCFLTPLVSRQFQPYRLSKSPHYSKRTIRTSNLFDIEHNSGWMIRGGEKMEIEK